MVGANRLENTPRSSAPSWYSKSSPARAPAHVTQPPCLRPRPQHACSLSSETEHRQLGQGSPAPPQTLQSTPALPLRVPARKVALLEGAGPSVVESPFPLPRPARPPGRPRNERRRGGRPARPEPTLTHSRPPRPARALRGRSAHPRVSPRGNGKGPADLTAGLGACPPPGARTMEHRRRRPVLARPGEPGFQRIPQAGERGRQAAGSRMETPKEPSAATAATWACRRLTLPGASADSSAKSVNYRHCAPSPGLPAPRPGGRTRKPVESVTSLPPGPPGAALNSAG